MNTLSADKWSQYWQKGTITTFHKKFEDNYDGPIKEHWESVFSGLSKHNAVVDLATGNGALLGLLNSYSLQHDINIKAVGVDFAAVEKRLFADFQGLDLTVKEHTRMEETGCESQSFDLAISQYGFEYANTIEAVKELDRICKDKCKVSFIMHDDNSQIVREGHQSLAQIKLVNDQLKLPEIIKHLLPAIDKYLRDRSDKHKQKADRYRDKLNAAIEKLQQAAAQFDDPGYLQFFHENGLSVFNPKLTGHLSLTQKLDVLKKIENETRALKSRMIDLTSVAMNDEKNKTLIAELKKYEFVHITIEQLQYNEFHIGQLLTAER